MRLDTAKNIINDAAIEAGLISAAVADVYASTNAVIVQMRAMLKSIGQTISEKAERGWSHLQAERTFDTAIGTASYALPAGFLRMIPQTGWNRTTQVPLDGPLSPQEWQFSKAQSSSPRLYASFRPWQQKVHITPTPGAVQTIAFEYITFYWVAVTGSIVPTKDGPTANDDVVLFDRLLMVKALKFAILDKKGLATVSDQDEYEDALKDALDRNAAAMAKILSLNGRRSNLKLLNASNVPDGNWGQ